jgi:hypothetical protein
MPSHQNSSQHSQHLCDALFRSAEAALGGAETHSSTNWCSYSTGSSPRFCFVQHNAGKIRIFLKALEADGPRLTSLLPAPPSIDLVRREKMTSDWAKITAYFADISEDQQVADVVPVLVQAARNTIDRSRTVQRAVWNSPSEIAESDASFWEGAKTTIQVNRYERNARARNACIKRYGALCSVCGFDFGQRYGSLGSGFIHVHHLVQMSENKEKYKLKPAEDLRPVCPNCHEMLHRKDPPLSIEQLKEQLRD